MEQLQQLFDMLSQTPEMALWGAGLYFLFILLKVASWVGSLTIIAKLLLTRLFDWLNNRISIEQKQLENKEAARVLSYFYQRRIDNVSIETLFRLLDSVRIDSSYIHLRDIEKAISLIEASKKEK